MLKIREEQAYNTRKKVIETMMQLMVHKDFDKLSIRDICKESGISIGTFYYHFGSKNELLEKMYKDYCLEFEERVVEKLEGLSHIEKIVMYCTYHTKNISNLSWEFKKRIYSIDNAFLSLPEHRTESYMYKVVEDGLEKKIFSTGKTAYEIVDNILKIDYGIAVYCCISNDYNSEKTTRELISSYLTKCLAHQGRLDGCS